MYNLASQIATNEWSVFAVGVIGFASLVVTQLAVPRAVAKRAAELHKQEREEDKSDKADVALAAKEAAEIAKKSAILTAGKLEQIHTLTNSAMTTSIENQLLVNRHLLAVLKQLVGISSTSITIAAIAAAETKISELELTLKERAEQTVIADNKLHASEISTEQLDDLKNELQEEREDGNTS